MNKKTGKVIIIILQVLSALGLIFIAFLLYKAYLTEKKEVETSSQFTKLDSYNVTEEELKIKVKDRDFVIKHDLEKTIINDKKIDFYAMKVYVTDSIIILSTVGQHGEVLQFYDKDLNKLYDSGTMQFSELSIVDGKISGSAINSSYIAVDGYIIENITIVPCTEQITTKISRYKNTIMKHEKELLEANYLFSYDTELLIDITNKQTIGDLFSLELTNDSGKYCIVI